MLPPGRVLDVGCGDGSVARNIAAHRGDIDARGVDVVVRPHTAIPVTEFDGRSIPLADDSVESVLLVDVLHHAADPIALLRECARVAPVVVVKDHLYRNAVDRRILAFMDVVGNRHHGVSLPFGFFSPSEFHQLVLSAGLEERISRRLQGLYPFPFSLIFERNLHFVARLERAVV